MQLVTWSNGTTSTSITDQNIFIGQYFEMDLTIQSSKSVNNATGGIYVDCTYQDETSASF